MLQVKERCPHLKVLLGGDEAYYSCELHSEICLLETGDECDVYEEFLKETESEVFD